MEPRDRCTFLGLGSISNEITAVSDSRVGALRRACTSRQRKNSIRMCPGHEAVLEDV